VPDTRFDAAFQQVCASSIVVVPVVLERVGHRLGNDGVGSEMHDGCQTACVRSTSITRVAIAHLSDDEAGLSRDRLP